MDYAVENLSSFGRLGAIQIYVHDRRISGQGSESAVPFKSQPHPDRR
jgi:hypothetical protein